MSTWPNRGGLRRPLRGAELKKDQTAKFSRSGWFDSHQPASTKAGVVQGLAMTRGPRDDEGVASR